MKKKLTAVMLLVALVLSIGLLTACNKDNKKGNGNDVTLTFAAPEGTPALAIARLITDNKSISGKNVNYKIVNPSNIAKEMQAGLSDLVIMPVNAGATLINKGADYKLVSVAVDGSLYLVGKIGKSETVTTLTIDDIKGKRIACIGQQGVPGLVFRYILKANNISIVDSPENVTENSVYIKYASDGTQARAAVENGSVNYAVVGEPAATTFKIKFGFNAQMDLQAEYKKVSGKETYPQAGIFVKSSLASDTAFMDALFAALKASKEWVKNNPQSVNDFMKANAYESAAFPKPSIAKCNVNAEKLTAEKKAEILAFLKNLAPGVNWDTVNLF
jgi:ABC transporter, substrate-binding lipoprotein